MDKEEWRNLNALVQKMRKTAAEWAGFGSEDWLYASDGLDAFADELLEVVNNNDKETP